jgi:cytochrome c peroxidase
MKWIFLLATAIVALHADPMLRPLPKKMHTDPDKAALGKKLFFDTRLSKNDTVSCATCHNLEEGGDDGLPVSFGVDGKQGNINSPTVLNAVFNFRQFWDGRAKDLKEQAKGPITNPVEMGNTFEHLVRTLKRTEYRKLFEQIYPDGITAENIVDAIAEFEKTLVTPSPYDRYLNGESEALTREQKEGLALFRDKGCIVCHHGVNLGGTMYSRFGVVHSTDSADMGRYNVTHDPQDRYAFKVPTLRNVALTAPYFHDGRTENLQEAVALMANVQLGRAMSHDEIRKIVAFLESLTGELPGSAK